jgi:hypothetical protein
VASQVQYLFSALGNAGVRCKFFRAATRIPVVLT